MKKHLLSIIRYFQQTKQKMKWRAEYKSLLQGASFQQLKPELDDNNKYLIILPHSDDEWIGCSTIISNPIFQTLICNADMPGGDSIEIHCKRKKEIERLAKKYNREVVTLSEEKPKELAHLIITYNPDCVFVPYWFDWHPEHIQVIDILKSCLDLCREVSFEIGMYQVTVPICLDNITHKLKMNKDQWNLKWSEFRLNYKTQRHFPWYRVALNELLQGRSQSLFACEVFTVLGKSLWEEKYYSSKATEIMQHELKQSLNSLLDIRKIKQPIIF